jgi:hypothetical protein
VDQLVDYPVVVVVPVAVVGEVDPWLGLDPGALGDLLLLAQESDVALPLGLDPDVGPPFRLRVPLLRKAVHVVLGKWEITPYMGVS